MNCVICGKETKHKFCTECRHDKHKINEYYRKKKRKLFSICNICGAQFKNDLTSRIHYRNCPKCRIPEAQHARRASRAAGFYGNCIVCGAKLDSHRNYCSEACKEAAKTQIKPLTLDNALFFRIVRGLSVEETAAALSLDVTTLMLHMVDMMKTPRYARIKAYYEAERQRRDRRCQKC